MASKKELWIAYGLAIYLLLVGVLSYAAFPAKTPAEPVRKVFTNAAGKVLFDHKTHASADGYSLSCADCHHHFETDDMDIRPCAECHQAAADTESASETCGDCHDMEEIEDHEVMPRVDAFHNQCITCHKDFGAGPEECSICHMR